MAASQLPEFIGLCPDPGHTGEFYMPLDGPEGICPECPEPLVVYVKTAAGSQVERAGRWWKDAQC